MGQSLLTVVTGSARSGKSRWAEHLALSSGLDVTYVATAARDVDDPLWEARLAVHRRRRPSAWQCQEVGIELPECLDAFGDGSLALVDSLGSWVVQGLELDAATWEQHGQRLIAAITHCAARVIIVSEQTGWGVVPATAIGGLFRDRLGLMEQRLMAIASTGWLVVAGRAIDLVSNSMAVPER